MAKKVLLEIQVDSDLNKLNAVEKELRAINKQRSELNRKAKTAEGLTIKETRDLTKLNVQNRELTRQKGQLTREVVRNNNATNKLISAYDKESQELNSLRKQLKNAILEEGKMSKKSRQLAKDVAVLDTKLKRVDAAAGQFQRNVGNYQGGFKGMAANIGKSALAAGAMMGGATLLFDVFRSGVKTVREFEQSGANLAAVLGVNKDEIKALTEDAKRLGAQTAFSATQVSELQTEFAKLGFTEGQILNATEATLNLAAATGAELGEAAAIAGATLGGFGLAADQTGRITDVMAKSFSSSALDLEKFKESMKAAAPAAKAVGVDAEQTTALLGTLANAGISGSKAGNALKNSFINLNKEGLTLQDGFDKVNNSSDKLSTAVQLVGKEAAAAFLVMAEGTEDTAELEAKLRDAGGAAAQMAETQLDTLDGAIKILQSSWEGFILSMDDGGGTMSNIAKIIIQDLSAGLGVLSGNTEALTDKFSFFGILFNNLKISFSVLRAEFEVVVAIFKQVGKVFEEIAVKMGLVTEESGGMEQALLVVQQIFFKLPKIIGVFADIAINHIGFIGDAIVGVVDIFMGWFDVVRFGAAAIINNFKAIGEVIAAVFTNPFDIKNIKQSINNAITVIGDGFAQGLENSKKIIEGGKKVGEAVMNGFNNLYNPENIDKVLAAVFEEDATEAEKAAEELGEDLADATKDGLKKGLKGGKTIDQIIKESIEEDEKLKKEEVTLDIRATIKPDLDANAKAAKILSDAEKKVAADKLATQKALRDATIQLAQETADAIFQIQQANSERRKQFEIDQLEISSQAEEDNLKARLDSGLITQAEYENNRVALEQETQDKRREIELDAFNRKKRLDTAQALINGALAITKTFATYGFTPIGAIAAGGQAVSTGIQVGVIQSQKFAKGGLLMGDSHAQGGIPFTIDGRGGFEAEGGEAIINKRSTEMFGGLLSAINQAGGGVAFASGGITPKFANGGMLSSGSPTGDLDAFSEKIINGINDKKVINVATETASVNNEVVNIGNDVSL